MAFKSIRFEKIQQALSKRQNLPCIILSDLILPIKKIKEELKT